MCYNGKRVLKEVYKMNKRNIAIIAHVDHGKTTLVDKLLNEVYVVGTPGVGFGPSGEGYFRLTAFGSRENTKEAIERIKQHFSK